jgi:hypothetical protein
MPLPHLQLLNFILDPFQITLIKRGRALREAVAVEVMTLVMYHA